MSKQKDQSLDDWDMVNKTGKGITALEVCGHLNKTGFAVLPAVGT